MRPVHEGDDDVGILPAVHHPVLEVLEHRDLVLQTLQGAIVLDGDGLRPLAAPGVQALQQEAHDMSVVSQPGATEEVLGATLHCPRPSARILGCSMSERSTE